MPRGQGAGRKKLALCRSPPKAAHGGQLVSEERLDRGHRVPPAATRQAMALSVDRIRASTPGQHASGPASSRSSPAVPP
jgi:hypothetical protein